MSITIIGDIGRIARIELIDIDNDRSSIGKKPHYYLKQFRSSDCKSLEDMVKKFFNHYERTNELKNGQKQIEAYFALPCPIKEDTIDTSESRKLLGWDTIYRTKIQKQLCEATGLIFNENKEVKFLNDYEAIGYGISKLKSDDFIELPPFKDNTSEDPEKEKTKKTEKIVIGAGSGLGVVSVTEEAGEQPIVVRASEGGHARYSPYSEKTTKLLNYLREQEQEKQKGLSEYEIHVDTEMVVSGKGIVNIYQFLRSEEEKKQKKKQKGEISEIVDAWLEDDKNNIASLDPAAQIARVTLFSLQKEEKTDEEKLCEETMEIFIQSYAILAANLALTNLSYGGVYIAGSIAPRILPLFKKYKFREVFNKQWGGEKILQHIPLYVIRNPNIGLLGIRKFMELTSQKNNTTRQIV